MNNSSRFNYRLAGILVFLTLMAAFGFYLLHRSQVSESIANARQQASDAVDQQDWDQAAFLLKHYLQSHPDDADSLALYAQVLIESKNDRQAAVELLDRVLSLDSTRDDVRLKQVAYALEGQKLEDAQKHLRLLLSSQPTNLEVLYLNGCLQQAVGRDADAIQQFEEVIEHDPGHPRANERLVNLYARSGSLQKMEEVVRRVKETSPDDLVSKRLLAESHFRRGEFEEANKLVLDALASEIDNGDATPLIIVGARNAIRLAFIYRNQAKTQAGLDLLNSWQNRLISASENNPDSVFFEMSLAELQDAAGKKHNAKETLRLAIERLPDHPELSFQLAWYSIQQREFDEAEDNLRQLTPTASVSSLREIVRSLRDMHQGRYLVASVRLGSILDEGFPSPEIVAFVAINHARCCEALQDWNGATEAYRTALNSNPQDTALHYRHALAHFAAGRHETAIHELKRARRLKDLILSDLATKLDAHPQPLIRTLNDNDSGVLSKSDHAYIQALIAAARNDIAQAHVAIQACSKSVNLADMVTLIHGDGGMPIATLKAVVAQQPDDVRALTALLVTMARDGQRHELDRIVREYESIDVDQTQRSPPQMRIAKACLDAARVAKKHASRQSDVLFEHAERLAGRILKNDDSEFFNFVDVLVEQGKTANAIEIIKQSRRKHPELAAEAWVMCFGRTSNDPQVLHELETWLSQSLRENSDNIRLRHALADVYLTAERYDEAIAEYQRIVDRDHTYVSAINNLSWLRAVTAIADKSTLELIDRAIQIAGHQAQLLDTRGCVQLAIGNNQEAATNFNCAIQRGSQPNFFFHLALAFCRQDQLKAAREAMGRASAMGFDVSLLNKLEQPMFREVEQTLLLNADQHVLSKAGQ
ncbi:MAG: tetratricopeptide repeat protein [Planctomycetota bacterium]|nr:tetratricopeptide repeat protein [Planctomycetota bacterium]